MQHHKVLRVLRADEEKALLVEVIRQLEMRLAKSSTWRRLRRNAEGELEELDIQQGPFYEE